MAISLRQIEVFHFHITIPCLTTGISIVLNIDNNYSCTLISIHPSICPSVRQLQWNRNRNRNMTLGWSQPWSTHAPNKLFSILWLNLPRILNFYQTKTCHQSQYQQQCRGNVEGDVDRWRPRLCIGNGYGKGMDEKKIDINVSNGCTFCLISYRRITCNFLWKTKKNPFDWRLISWIAPKSLNHIGGR